MVKIFPTVRDTQEVQIYMEKKRGRKEVDVTRRRRQGVKRGESSLASNQFPICSPHSKRFKEFHREGKREKGDRGDLDEKRERQRGESNQASNHTPKWKWILKIRFLEVQN